MPDPSENSSPADIAEIIQKLYRLRKRFALVGTDHVVGIQERLLSLGLMSIPDDKTIAEIGDFDILYDIGIVFSQQERPLTMGEISRKMDVPLSKATRIVDWLVDNQCAERFADPEDRRIVRVRLTPVGQEMYQAINLYFIESAERLLSSFSPTDRQTFLSLLGCLLDTAEQEHK